MSARVGTRIIGCQRCGHLACVCCVIREHPNPECHFRLSTTCAIPVECDHGFDVCPECDPCTCSVDTRGDDGER